MLSSEARIHIATRLEKSQQFLDYAGLSDGDDGYRDGLVSLCVTAGINASDAVLVANGATINGRRNHDQAPRDLRQIGQDQMAAALAKLLKLKWKAQYSPERCSAADARTAIAQSRRALGLATAECERRLAQ